MHEEAGIQRRQTKKTVTFKSTNDGGECVFGWMPLQECETSSSLTFAVTSCFACVLFGSAILFLSMFDQAVRFLPTVDLNPSSLQTVCLFFC